MDKVATFEKQAIEAAMRSDWEKAIKLNEQILKSEKKNVDAYLRLGFANMQAGKIRVAKKHYKKALLIQPGNLAIQESLERIKILESKRVNRLKNVNLDPYLFLDSPGKTKTVTLVNCGQKSVLARLTIGQELSLLVKKRRVEVRTKEGDYVGCLPDDISKRLTIFIKAGSVFQAFVKESNLKQTVVFLKEFKKGKKVTKYISFPINIQANMQSLTLTKDESGDGGEEEIIITDSDLEQLAESLSEEKDYLGFGLEDKEDEPEE